MKPFFAAFLPSSLLAGTSFAETVNDREGGDIIVGVGRKDEAMARFQWLIRQVGNREPGEIVSTAMQRKRVAQPMPNQ